jgi:hypothetical protein
MTQTASQFGDAIDRRLTEGSARWAQALAKTQREFIENALRPALEETARSVARLDSLEEKVALQTAALNETLRASADLTALEERFARSLEKIAEVGEFEKTLNNLSATVCLLNSKLTSAPYSETVRFDAGVSRRVSKREEALAALDSLENSLDSKSDAAPETIVMPNFDAESDVSKSSAPEIEGSASPAKRTRASLGRKRSA